MDVGSRVRDKNNGSVGIIERQNLSSYLVSFEGGKKLWRKAHELEAESARSSSNLRSSTQPATPPRAAPLTLPTTSKPAAYAQPAPQHQPQPQQQPPARTALGGGASPVLGRTSLGQPAPAPGPVLRPGLAMGAAPPQTPPRPALGSGGAPSSSPNLTAKNPAAPPSPKQSFDSTDQRKPVQNVNVGNGSGSKGGEAPKAELAPPPQKMSFSDTLTSPQDEEMWNIAFAELEFGDVIGSGKFGEVYLGTYLGTPVAIKKILDTDEDTKKSIEREIAMLKGVKHPNIVQFLGLCLHKEDIFLVTEYMDRGDLFDVLFFGDATLSWKMKLKIALDIAMPCYYMQAKNILHRDLKSQNILLCSESYKAKLCDLGLARAFDTHSRRMTFVGTDRWMAPEICLGIDYDYKVDVFSYGVVLMEIITQAVPEERRAQDRFAFNEGSFRSQVPKSCPATFSQLAIDCTKLDPRTRPTFKAILERVKNMYEEQDDDD